MRDFITRHRPSPALAIAFLALLVALSGTAVALPGRNTVDSGDIKNHVIRNQDLRGNAVTGAKVRRNSLTGGDVRGLGGGDVNADSLTGEDINEGTLGQVPQAATAAAVNGITRPPQITAAVGQIAGDRDQGSVDPLARVHGHGRRQHRGGDADDHERLERGGQLRDPGRHGRRPRSG